MLQEIGLLWMMKVKEGSDEVHATAKGIRQ